MPLTIGVLDAIRYQTLSDFCVGRRNSKRFLFVLVMLRTWLGNPLLGNARLPRLRLSGLRFLGSADQRRTVDWAFMGRFDDLAALHRDWDDAPRVGGSWTSTSQSHLPGLSWSKAMVTAFIGGTRTTSRRRLRGLVAGVATIVSHSLLANGSVLMASRPWRRGDRHRPGGLHRAPQRCCVWR